MVYTIIVNGKPASHNANAQRKGQWKARVQAAARQVFPVPLQDNDLRVTVTFYFDGAVRRGRMDADNASKPICDALQGIAYTNDQQVSARHAHKRDISATFRVKGADPSILNAVQRGNEFVSIKIDNEGSDIHTL
jgi:Holliday junction resolvase RusA-like endonuclease